MKHRVLGFSPRANGNGRRIETNPIKRPSLERKPAGVFRRKHAAVSATDRISLSLKLPAVASSLADCVRPQLQAVKPTSEGKASR
jgi:hypothetical protein